MNEQLFILNFDSDPRHDDRPFQFHEKLLYAFVLKKK